MNERIPPVGSQPKVTENRKMKTRPSQYAGMLSENTETRRISRSVKEFCLTAAMTPAPTPKTMANRPAAPVSSMVIQNFSITRGRTGRRCWMETPPIALRDVPEPSEVLHVGGIVEAVFLAQGLSRLRRGEHAHQDVDGVSGSKLDEGEYDGRRAEEHRYQEEESPSQEPEHFAGAPAWSHRGSARQGSLPRINAAWELPRRPPPGVRPLMPEPLGPALEANDRRTPGTESADGLQFMPRG